ncbi:MAG: choice-of-anchor P family protein [Streptosporangiaceae bacterium]
MSKIPLLGLTAALVMAGSLVAQSPAAFAGTTENGFGASAYGTEVNVANLVTSGRSALSTLGCTSQVGITHTNSVASVGAPPLLTSGTVSTSTATQATATGVASTSTSTIQNVSLLGGLVSVGALTSQSTTSRNTATGGFGVSSAGTQFASLKVLGLPILVQPGPNTEIALPGVGSVILNQQTSHVSKKSANLTVIAIHIDVTITTPLANAGTQIVVSFANSSLGGPVSGLLSGYSYGAKANLANLANVVSVGPLFPQPLACFGTNGAVKTNAGAIVAVPASSTAGQCPTPPRACRTPAGYRVR